MALGTVGLSAYVAAPGTEPWSMFFGRRPPFRLFILPRMPVGLIGGASSLIVASVVARRSSGPPNDPRRGTGGGGLVGDSVPSRGLTLSVSSPLLNSAKKGLLSDPTLVPVAIPSGDRLP